jgi:hypothetical protein
MNLHAIVREAINIVNPDEPVTLYQALGQTNNRGTVTPRYQAGLSVLAQIQPEDDNLEHREALSTTAQGAEFWLFSDPSLPVTGISRQPMRGGDIIKRADGAFWLVDNSIEDWTPVGWAHVHATLQITPPEDVDDT